MKEFCKIFDQRSFDGKQRKQKFNEKVQDKINAKKLKGVPIKGKKDW